MANEIKTPVRYDGEYIRDANNEPVGLADAVEIVEALNAARPSDMDFVSEKEDAFNRGVAFGREEVADLKAQLGFAKTLADESNDQRDAAVIAAKALGDEVQKLREDRRMWRMNAAEWDGLFMALSAGVEDIDLGQLVTQLDLIGRMADEQGNGADARLCFDASQVVAMVEHTLDKLLDE